MYSETYLSEKAKLWAKATSGLVLIGLAVVGALTILSAVLGA